MSYFQEDLLPSALGNYRYMRYRGPGHVVGGRKLYFMAEALVSNGLLELIGFDSVDSPEL